MTNKLEQAIWNRSKGDTRLQNLLAWGFYRLGRNSTRLRGQCNTIQCRGSFLRNVRFDIVGDDNSVIIGRGTRLSNTRILIRGSHHRLQIGECCVYSGGSLWFEDFDNGIVIGEKTQIVEAHIAVTEPHSTIRIGNECMFSNDIDVRNGDSHSIIDVETQRRVNFAKDVSIGDHVWIGAHTRILKGTQIGDGAIVGTGSVVTDSIPAGCLAAGVPARVLRKGVTWTRERIYE